jgi:ATP-dependent RNA helicase SUPV3L1/SUV3
LLWALWTDRPPHGFEPPKAGLVSIPCVQDLPHAYYYAAGYRPSGARAVRIDMMERLAGQIRSERKDGPYQGGFEANQQMMSFVGCSGEEFELILSSLGYRKQTIKVKAAAEKPAERPSVEAAPEPDEAAEAPAEIAEAADDTLASAEAAAEQAPSVSADEIAVAEPQPEAADAAANLSPSTEPAAEKAAPDAPPVEASEREVVIWRFVPRRPPKKKHVAPAAPEEKRGKPKDRRPRDQKRRDAPPPRGPKPAAPSRPQMLHAPQHRKVADPNSPFAILAGLKDDLIKAGDNGKSKKSEPVQ